MDIRRLEVEVNMKDLENGDPTSFPVKSHWTPFYIEPLGGIYYRGEESFTKYYVWFHALSTK